MSGPVSEYAFNDEFSMLDMKDVRRDEIRLNAVSNGLEDYPETEDARIVCEGACGVPTRHAFLGWRRLRRTDGKSIHDELIYECRTCACVRVWGTQMLNIVRKIGEEA